MSKRKDAVADSTTTYYKPEKSGFGLRLTQAILFTVIAIGLIICSIFLYNSRFHCDTFEQWYPKKYDYGYSDIMHIKNDKNVKLISDKSYDNWEDISIEYDSMNSKTEAKVRYLDSSGTEQIDNYYYESANTTAKTVTFKAKSGESITFSYTLTQVYYEFIECDGWQVNFNYTLIVSIIFIVLFAVFAVLQFIGTFAGKNRQWGNSISTVIGAITTVFYLLGIFGLIGGIRGKKYLYAKEYEQQHAEHYEAATTTVSAPNIHTEQQEPALTAATEPTAPTASPANGYIKPKLSPKAQKAMMITLIISYTLLAIFGVICAMRLVGTLFADIGICQLIAAPAYSVIIGMMMIVGIPSIGYYFATIAPVKLSKKAKIILAVITTALMLALIATAFIVIYFVEVNGLTINNYFEGSDTWFVPLSLAFAPLGIMICYLLTLFRINPEKIRAQKPEQNGDGLAAVIKHVFAILIYGIAKLVKGILSFKEKQPEIFILVATILLTWLAFFTAFVFAIICIAVLVGVVIMYFTGVMSLYTPSAGNGGAPSPTDEYYKQDEYTYVDNYGYTQTVYTDRNGKEARDAGGRYVGEISGDGSEKKFTPAGSDSNE